MAGRIPALNRGEKMVATLNQPQYQPWPMEEQVGALYAGVNGFLDDIPTEDITRFQDELREHLRAQKDIYAQVREQGELSDDKAETLNAEIEKVKSRFATSEDKDS
jgi:F-type H+-transporting ATPase subunit alpha